MTTGRPGVTASDPPYGEPAAASHPEPGDRVERVRRAGGVVAAHLAVDRADHAPIDAQEPDHGVGQWRSHDRASRWRLGPWAADARAVNRRATASRQVSR